MLASEIVEALQAEVLNVGSEESMQKDYKYVFASDLMSDALALISNNENDTILLTGLCNKQSLRTAEMLDLGLIIYVRGKMIDIDDLNLAKEMNFNIFTTHYTLFEACGILYQNGLEAIKLE